MHGMRNNNNDNLLAVHLPCYNNPNSYNISNYQLRKLKNIGRGKKKKEI